MESHPDDYPMEPDAVVPWRPEGTTTVGFTSSRWEIALSDRALCKASFCGTPIAAGTIRLSRTFPAVISGRKTPIARFYHARCVPKVQARAASWKHDSPADIAGFDLLTDREQLYLLSLWRGTGGRAPPARVLPKKGRRTGPTSTGGPLQGKSFVFSNFRDEDLKTALVAAGAEYKPYLVKATSDLVYGELRRTAATPQH